MNEITTISDAQFQKLLIAIDTLKSEGVHWDTVIPVFLSATSGILVGIALEYFKGYKEKKKEALEKQRTELEQLNVAATATGYNFEILLHTVMQQILPHYLDSHAAALALQGTANNPDGVRKFFETMNANFRGMMTRCPEPYFINIDFFKDIPFVLAKDPDLLKRSGWMVSYIRALKELINERNKRIEIAGQADFTATDVSLLGEQVRVQAHLADGEIVNSYLLFQQVIAISKQLKVISQTYPKKLGPRLTVSFPEVLEEIIQQLKVIAEKVHPEMPAEQEFS